MCEVCDIVTRPTPVYCRRDNDVREIMFNPFGQTGFYYFNGCDFMDGLSLCNGCLGDVGCRLWKGRELREASMQDPIRHG